MTQLRDKVEDSHFEGEIELYGDVGIASYDAKVAKPLLFLYLLLPIWGIVGFYFFWNGSIGWFDRGYWRELQVAAKTTFPIENQKMIQQKPEVKEEQAQHSAD